MAAFASDLVNDGCPSEGWNEVASVSSVFIVLIVPNLLERMSVAAVAMVLAIETRLDESRLKSGRGVRGGDEDNGAASASLICVPLPLRRGSGVNEASRRPFVVTGGGRALSPGLAVRAVDNTGEGGVQRFLVDVDANCTAAVALGLAETNEGRGGAGGDDGRRETRLGVDTDEGNDGWLVALPECKYGLRGERGWRGCSDNWHTVMMVCATCPRDSAVPSSKSPRLNSSP